MIDWITYTEVEMEDTIKSFFLSLPQNGRVSWEENR